MEVSKVIREKIELNDLVQLQEFSSLSKEMLETVRQWRNAQFIRKWMFNDKVIEKNAHLQWISSLIDDDKKYYWLFMLKGQPIGVVYITNLQWDTKKGEMGYYIGSEECLGMGLGAVMEFYFLEFVFHALELKKILAYVLENNRAVIAQHLGFGFVVVGRGESSRHKKKHFQLELTDDSWIKQREQKLMLMKIFLKKLKVGREHYADK